MSATSRLEWPSMLCMAKLPGPSGLACFSASTMADGVKTPTDRPFSSTPIGVSVGPLRTVGQPLAGWTCRWLRPIAAKLADSRWTQSCEPPTERL